MRVDYHFHPNLPVFKGRCGQWVSRRKVARIWQALSEHEIDVLFVTEHSYKDPKRAYEAMEEGRPSGAMTHLIPGVELLTREGVDIILFSDDPAYLYAKRDLLHSRRRSTEEVIVAVEDDDRLWGIVPHPYSPSTTGMVRVLGEEYTKQAMRRLGGAERCNFSSVTTLSLLERLKLHRAFPRLTRKMQWMVEAPNLPVDDALLHSGGSDAHHVWEIGDCMELPGECPPSFSQALTVAVTTRGVPRVVTKRRYHLLPRSALTVLHECAIKHLGFYST